MARKRYETAFLPSTSNTSRSPDVDSLLLAIESNRLHDDERRGGVLAPFPTSTNTANTYPLSDSPENTKIIKGPSKKGGGSSKNTNSRPADPSILLCEQRRILHCQSSSATRSSSSSSSGGGSGSSSNPNSPRPASAGPPPKIMPLSEPLPIKRYTNISAAAAAPCDKRLMMMMKDNNSDSSLESLDSTKSEELQPVTLSRYNSYGGSSSHSSNASHSRGGGGGGGGGGGVGNNNKCTLLSPISDKSPLDPTAMMQHNSSLLGVDGKDIHGCTVPNQWAKTNLMSASELTNVPWEMPKLRRKLALLADSGISLDFSGNREADLFGGGNILKDRDSESFSTFARVHSNKFGGDSHHHNFFSSSSSSSASHHHNNHHHNHHHHHPLQGIRGRLDLRLESSDSELQDSRYASFNVSLDCYEEGISDGQQEELDADSELEALVDNLENKIVENDNNSSSKLYQDLPCTSSSLFSTTAAHQQQQQHLHQIHHQLPHRQSPLFGGGGGGGGVLGAKPNRCRMKLDFTSNNNRFAYEIDPRVELETQDWFHGAITRYEAENILRATKEGSFLVRNCESSTFNRYSLSLKSARGFIHIRIEPNSLGTFSLGEEEFQSVPYLVLHFMSHRLPIKGAEHVKLKYPVITQLL